MRSTFLLSSLCALPLREPPPPVCLIPPLMPCHAFRPSLPRLPATRTRAEPSSRSAAGYSAPCPPTPALPILRLCSYTAQCSQYRITRAPTVFEAKPQMARAQHRPSQQGLRALKTPRSGGGRVDEKRTQRSPIRGYHNALCQGRRRAARRNCPAQGRSIHLPFSSLSLPFPQDKPAGPAATAAAAAAPKKRQRGKKRDTPATPPPPPPPPAPPPPATDADALEATLQELVFNHLAAAGAPEQAAAARFLLCLWDGLDAQDPARAPRRELYRRLAAFEDSAPARSLALR